MKHLLKEHPWECMAYSFAMALGLESADFYTQIGHDGSSIAFPGLPEPICRRGVHPNECVLVALHNGFNVTPFEVCPQLASSDCRTIISLAPHWLDFKHYILTRSGVLEGWTAAKCKHAVAFDHGHIFDPDGGFYWYSKSACEQRGFYGNRVWIVQKD